MRDYERWAGDNGHERKSRGDERPAGQGQARDWSAIWNFKMLNFLEENNQELWKFLISFRFLSFEV